MLAGIAHLWLITLHPFEDGNGRLARAVTDMAIARDEQRPMRLFSLSAQIQRRRGAYYKILERTQRGDLDVTPWLVWFLEQVEDAATEAPWAELSQLTTTSSPPPARHTVRE